MSQTKWRFKIKRDGEIEVEGMNFSGDQCIHDIIYQLIQQNSNVVEEKRLKAFDESPVHDIYYVEGN